MYFYTVRLIQIITPLFRLLQNSISHIYDITLLHKSQ